MVERNFVLNIGDVWQIAVFADLYADKVSKTGYSKQADYARALRLYTFCVESGVDNGYFETKVADLKEVWRNRTE